MSSVWHLFLQIQERTGAKVNFKDDVPIDGGSDSRTVVVRGTHTSAQQAELEIKQVIAAQPPIITDTIVVPDRSIGRIIGKCRTLNSSQCGHFYTGRMADSMYSGSSQEVDFFQFYFGGSCEITKG